MHPQILVPQKYTVKQVRRAELKRDEFRPNRYTSGSANLDDMIACNKAVLLCEAHSRKFSPKAARYMAHPSDNLRRVHGRCDVCQTVGLSFLYICQRDGEEELKKVERFKRAIEYGKLFSN